jgi:uncharacterized membrane protein
LENMPASSLLLMPAPSSSSDEAAILNAIILAHSCRPAAFIVSQCMFIFSYLCVGSWITGQAVGNKIEPPSHTVAFHFYGTVGFLAGFVKGVFAVQSGKHILYCGCSYK